MSTQRVSRACNNFHGNTHCHRHIITNNIIIKLIENFVEYYSVIGKVIVYYWQMRPPITITITITGSIWPDYYHYYYSGIWRSLLLLLSRHKRFITINITITISNSLTTLFLCHILFPIYVSNYVWVCMCLCVNSLNVCNCTHEKANKIFWILNLAWRKCVRCIFNIPCNTHCKLVPLFCKDVAIQIKLYKLFLNDTSIMQNRVTIPSYPLWQTCIIWKLLKSL